MPENDESEIGLVPLAVPEGNVVPEPEAEVEADEHAEHAVVRVAGAPWIDSVVLTLANGDTVTVSRKGLDVPASQVDEIVSGAAKIGVLVETGN